MDLLLDLMEAESVGSFPPCLSESCARVRLRLPNTLCLRVCVSVWLFNCVLRHFLCRRVIGRTPAVFDQAHHNILLQLAAPRHIRVYFQPSLAFISHLCLLLFSSSPHFPPPPPDVAILNGITEHCFHHLETFQSRIIFPPRPFFPRNEISAHAERRRAGVGSRATIVFGGGFMGRHSAAC